jgi:hypothetical protein
MYLWEKQLQGIYIRIEYQDILGNKQNPCERTFDQPLI